MKLSISIVTLFTICVLISAQTQAQVNHKPVFVSHRPVFADTRFLPIRFSVSAYDPDGDGLTFTWKQNSSIVQSGSDSSYLLLSAPDPHGSAVTIICVFSDPGGLSDSTYWRLLPPDLVSDQHVIPSQLELAQNYPNPFNPSTTISYSVPRSTMVLVRIFNALGQEVALLVNDLKEAGTYQLRWNASNVRSGTYFYRLQVEEFVQTKKMLLLR
ncbi:MAG: T9SS type A sorting domain-containing protein [Ignavibacteriales bacterium]|nr:T9SS type A sorting domain-containing protein [Ignavibacteriales bacterium]